MRKVLLISLSFLLLAAVFWMYGCGKSKSAGQVGKEFAAELTTLDGKAFSIPNDTQGKVIVVDFWASWCPPCRQAMPHMKQLHEKYKGKDVVIVGISLDDNRAALEKYIKDTGILWVITYTGKRWSDPTVQEYGVDGIPAVWVIGKDGKVISTNAETNTGEIIDKALKN